MSAALRLVECRAVLGGERDPFRVVWDEQTTAKDRRLLLAMAGQSAPMAGHLAGRAWCDLRAEVRAEILRGMKRWRAWAERLQ